MGQGKNALYPNKIATAGSLAADYFSPYFNVQYLDNIYITCKFTGTPTGTFAVQGSGDGGLSWQNIRLLTSPVASGVADQIGIEINQAPMPLLRVAYTRISGTGVIEIWTTGKAIS
jgi:hypothetical protein